MKREDRKKIIKILEKLEGDIEEAVLDCSINSIAVYDGYKISIIVNGEINSHFIRFIEEDFSQAPAVMYGRLYAVEIVFYNQKHEELKLESNYAEIEFNYKD